MRRCELFPNLVFFPSYLIPVVLPILWSLTTQGTEPIKTNSTTALARGELGAALSRYNGITHLRVRFRQTKHLRSLNFRIPSEGYLTVRPPDWMRWEITKPERLIVTMDGQTIEMTSGSGKNISTERLERGAQITEHAFTSLAMLSAWLKLDVDALFERYVIHRNGVREYEFLPKETPSPPVTKITMRLGRSGHLERLLMHEASGDELDIRFDAPTIRKANAK